jgi:hypothetical protein
MAGGRVTNTIGQIISLVEDTIINREIAIPDPAGYSPEELRGATKVFMHFLIDAMWSYQESVNMETQERENAAENAGKTLRKLILEHTGIDTHSLYTIDEEE